MGNTGNLSKLSGAKLLDAAAKQGLEGVTNNVRKKVWSRVGIKIYKGIAFGSVNTGVSLLSDKFLKEYCCKIITQLFIKVRKPIESNKQTIHQSLKVIYEKFGPQKVESWLTELNRTYSSAR